MRLIGLCSIVALFIHTGAVRGDEATSSEPAHVACPAIDKLDHLLNAAKQLEAAGMAEQAEELRKQYAELKHSRDEALLRQRLGELDRLQAEVDDLKRKTGRAGQILVRVQAVEVSLDNQPDSDALIQPAPKGSQSPLLDLILKPSRGDASARTTVVDRAVAAAALAALREKNVLKVLAEPALVTVDGRPAFFNSGGEFPILARHSDGSADIDFKKYGTQMDFVGKLLGSGKIRMDVKLRVSELDPTLSVTAEGVTMPGLKVREFDTGVEMESGRTAIIGGLVSNQIETVIDPKTKQESEVIRRVETVLLVTPELTDNSPRNTDRRQ